MKIVTNMTIGKMLENTVKSYSGNNAVEYMGEYWSYRQLDEKTDELAYLFLNKGLCRAKKAGLLVGNTPNALFVFLALEKIGAIPVLLHTSWTMEEVQTYLDFVEADCFIYDENYKDDYTTEIGINSYCLTDLINASQSLSIIEKEQLKCEEDKVLATDTDVILFTSGSTDKPKAVVTNHFSRVNNAYAQAEILKANYQDVFCTLLPMFHCFSLSGNIMAALSCGACISFPLSRKTEHVLKAIERSTATVLNAVPTFYSALLANKTREQYKTDSLRAGVIGGAGYSSDFFMRVEKELGIKLIPSLGLTEATAGITAGRYEDTSDSRAEHVGGFLEHIEGKIKRINSTEEVAKGEIGEICVRGYNVMQMYYKQQQLTAEVIDEEGFLHTGDTGYLDADGNVYITGRCKEIIIRGGENIAPAGIENIIGELPEVERVKVIGVPDEHFGEEICACVECVFGKTVSEEDIRHHLKGRIAEYKIPRYIRFLEMIPMTGSGKVNIEKLRQLAVAEEE